MVVKARVRKPDRACGQVAEPLDRATSLAVRASAAAPSRPRPRRRSGVPPCAIAGVQAVPDASAAVHARPRMELPASRPAASGRRRDDSGSGCDGPPDIRPGRYCGPPGIGGAGRSSATRTRGSLRSGRERPSGSSRLVTPQDSSISRRASANRRPNRSASPRRPSTRGQYSSSSGSATESARTFRVRSAKDDERRIRPGLSNPRRGSRPATDRSRPPAYRSGRPRILGTRIDADLGISLSTIRFKASPPARSGDARQRRSS